jgi:hypothetical protein
MTDYTKAEIEALAELATTTLLDDWHSWSSSQPADETLWFLDPELADQVETAHRRHRRLNDACKMLYLRGLLERRTFPSLGGGFWYRLIPMLKPDRADAADGSAVAS